MRAAAEGMDGGSKGAWAVGVAGMAAAVAWFLSPFLSRVRQGREPVPFAAPTVIVPSRLLPVPLAVEAEVATASLPFVPVPAPAEIPQSVLDGIEEALAPPPTQVPVRPVPSPLGGRVLSALDGCEPMRKCDIARLVGVGRGSANRVVDALVASGWLREQDRGFFVLA